MGAGQALFFTNPSRPLTFGRSDETCDVRIDADPDKHGFSMMEFAVSRRHFELTPPRNGKLKIHDLGSTNGVNVYIDSSKTRVHIDRNSPDAEMSVGDFAIFGGSSGGETLDLSDSSGRPLRNPKEWARYVGFRVCKNEKDEIFLVKFNAKTIEELLNLSGETITTMTEDQRSWFLQEAAKLAPNLDPGVSSTTETEKSTEKKDLGVTFKVLFDEMTRLKEAIIKGKFGSPEILEGNEKILAFLIDSARRLGKKYYSDDWTLGAAKIGKYAIDQSQEALDKGNKKEASAAVDVATLAMKLANNQLIPFSKEE